MEDRAVVRDRQWDRLAEEVPGHLVLWLVLLLGKLLLLGRRVLEGARCPAVAGGLDLLVESNRHVGLL